MRAASAAAVSLAIDARRLLRLLARVATVAAALAPAASAHAQVTVTFLANEGVMLSGGGKKVLIDALFRKYKRGFAVPADSTQAALQAARPPFDGVDLILVTHRHGDHFHPAPLAAHLLANPRATLLTSAQVIDSLRRHPPARILPTQRLLARTTAPATRRREVVNGVTVELLGLRHHDLEHLGFIVDVGGRRVLHVGDVDDAETAFPPFRLDTARIDVALLPYWMVRSTEGRRAIARWIRPKQVVAFHVGAREGDRAPRAVRAAMPGAVTFVRSLETRTW
jgi:L-ascorbate metabolism protein UlaG (beta-lactamase superfamily)